MKTQQAKAVIRDGKIVVLSGKKVLKTYELNQEDKAKSYVHGWNQVR